MSDFSISVSGASAINARLDAWLADKTKRIDDAVQGAGIDCQADAKQHCPVGTPESTHKKGYVGGRLRSSIQYQRTGMAQCTVGTNVFYSWYVELGTYKMRAQPFLFPAYVKSASALKTELIDIFRS